MGKFFHTSNVNASKLTLKTSATTFTQLVEKSAGIPVFKFSKSVLAGESLIYNHAGPTIYYVDFLVNSALDAVKLEFKSQDIIGAVDLSEFENVSHWDMRGNPALTAITLPTNINVPVTYLNLSDNSLGGHMDLSPFTNISGSILGFLNTSLTGVTFPLSLSAAPYTNFSGCDLRNVNLSSLSELGGVISFASNSNLSAITFPISTAPVTYMYLNGCNFKDLDFTSLNIGGLMHLHDNSSLSSITFSTSTLNISTISAYSCNLGYVNFYPISGGSNDDLTITLASNAMAATDVNHILVDLDDIGWTGGTLYIAGTNAAPDGTSGGYNGTGATQNLIANGWTVTTS